ncbi:PREDICTED: collagen alpha-1(III) chain-like, partial [Gekko japonicus]|uniref:Collagen alpha-1(III) chain-like n=1 Tax=Gekko japonicus TaxID=146911 RepID=A0ABM1LD73_GEKJA
SLRQAYATGRINQVVGGGSHALPEEEAASASRRGRPGLRLPGRGGERPRSATRVGAGGQAREGGGNGARPGQGGAHGRGGETEGKRGSGGAFARRPEKGAFFPGGGRPGVPGPGTPARRLARRSRARAPGAGCRLGAGSTPGWGRRVAVVVARRGSTDWGPREGGGTAPPEHRREGRPAEGPPRHGPGCHIDRGAGAQVAPSGSPARRGPMGKRVAPSGSAARRGHAPDGRGGPGPLRSLGKAVRFSLVRRGPSLSVRTTGNGLGGTARGEAPPHLNTDPREGPRGVLTDAARGERGRSGRQGRRVGRGSGPRPGLLPAGGRRERTVPLPGLLPAGGRSGRGVPLPGLLPAGGTLRTAAGARVRSGGTRGREGRGGGDAGRRPPRSGAPARPR